MQKPGKKALITDHLTYVPSSFILTDHQFDWQFQTQKEVLF